MEIEIKDYLTDGDIKEIVIEEVKQHIRGQEERILSNLGYDVCGILSDELLTENQKKVFKANVKKVLNSEDSIKFEVYRKPDAWNRTSDFPLHEIIKKAILEKEDDIKNKVFSVIDKLDEEMIMKMIDDGDVHIIFDFLKLFIKLKKESE